MATFAPDSVAALLPLLAQTGNTPNQPMPGMFLLPLVVIGLLYYMMVLRPEQTNRSDHKTALDQLKQNDRVITAGGIHGVVVKATAADPEIVIRIDENNNTRIHIQRSSISRIVTDKDKAKDSQES